MMQVQELSLRGARLLIPQRHSDMKSRFSEYYSRRAFESGCIMNSFWNDPDLTIDWKCDMERVVLYEKDTRLPPLKEVPLGMHVNACARGWRAWVHRFGGCRHLLLNEDCQVLNIDGVTYVANVHSHDDISADPAYRFVQPDICNCRKLESLFADFARLSDVARPLL